MIVLKPNEDSFLLKIGNSYEPIEQSLIPVLCEEIQIEDGVTFGQFFDIILKHHEEYSEFFVSYLGGVPLSDFILEWNKKDISKLHDDMQFVRVSWGNYHVFKKELANGIDMGLLPNFDGVGKDANGKLQEYAIEFTPLNELKRFPLKLEPDSIIYDEETNEQIFKIERILSVFDVLSAIFYEITFTGNPSERDGKLHDMINRMKEINSEFDEYKKNSITLEDLYKKFGIDLPPDNINE